MHAAFLRTIIRVTISCYCSMLPFRCAADFHLAATHVFQTGLYIFNSGMDFVIRLLFCWIKSHTGILHGQ